jgi:hypothetical protein
MIYKLIRVDVSCCDCLSLDLLDAEIITGQMRG